MKPSLAFVFAVAWGLGSAAAQTSKPADAGATYLPGSQLQLICVHEHPQGNVGSTILYRTAELAADKLPRRLRVGRLTAIVITFTHVNTFCYSYDAGVSSQTSFYGPSVPDKLKPFFIGGLGGAPALSAGGDPFQLAQGKFGADYAAYLPLGQMAAKVASSITGAIDPKKENKDIREDVRTALNTALGYSDRDAEPEDLTFRQAELKTGIDVLSNDMKNLRSQLTQSKGDTQDTELKEIGQDEEAASELSKLAEDYATAIDNLNKVRASKDFVQKIVMLDPHDDEFVVTTSVSLLNPKPTAPGEPPAAGPVNNSVIVDVTGSRGLDFSIGVVATNPVNHDYYLSGKSSPYTIKNGGGDDPAFVPAAFLMYYKRPAPGQFAFGPAFGVDLSTAQNYFFGIGVVRAGAQRISLVGGLALNRITEIDGYKPGDQFYMNSIPTKTRYLGGYFCGLTFNFGG